MLDFRKVVPLWGLCVCSMGLAADASAQPAGFVVEGATGEKVLLDRLWQRGCVPGTNGNAWTQASRTLVGFDLTFTLIDYQNKSTSPDCTNGRVGKATFTIVLSADGKQVPITWVNAEGKPAAAPSGLEGIAKANGVTGLMTLATITPETALRAAQLNEAKFCARSDWALGVGREAVACLTGGFNPFKATIVVDNRTRPWRVYDGAGPMFDASGYPVGMANYLPHTGPFPLP